MIDDYMGKDYTSWAIRILLLVAIIFIIYIIATTVMGTVRENLICNESGGHYNTYGICLKEIDNELVEYEVVKYKDEWRLLKK